MPYTRLAMDDGTEILVEVEVPKDYQGPLSEDAFQNFREQFIKVMDLIKITARDAHKGYQSIPEEYRPKELELVFGLKLAIDAGIIISKVGSESSFQATLRWK